MSIGLGIRSRTLETSWLRFLAVAGPGVVVAFADTEAGSITTAVTSGAQFGFKLVLLQVLLIVPLFVVQEMTARLGSVTGKGHARLIRERYGLAWAWVSLGTMLVTNVAALVTEFAGIAGAALIFGLNPVVLVGAAALLLMAVILLGAYNRVEWAALTLCALELLFIPAALAAHPSPAAIVREGLFGSQPLANNGYLLLVASNIGAVIMPWMIFYQQSATVAKGLRVTDLQHARIDTALGALFTQLIMIAIVVTAGASLYVHHVNVTDAAHAAIALQPLVGRFAGVVFGAGLIGASMLGALVVSLTTAWAFGEAFGWPCSLNAPCQKAKRFYGLYAACIAIAAIIVLLPHLALVKITLYVEAFNGFVLPIVLGFLLVMVNDRRIIGKYRNSWVTNTVTLTLSAIIIGLGLWMAGSVYSAR